MPVPIKNYHRTQVRSWADLNCHGLTAGQLVRLFGSALRAVEQRSLHSLSNITVMVVVDRALHECAEKHPILALAKAEPEGIDLSALLGNSGNYKLEELREALESLLATLLTVLGNITADILTAPLHKALFEVSRDHALRAPEKQTLHMVKSIDTKREKP